jgi:hypothetical protein
MFNPSKFRLVMAAAAFATTATLFGATTSEVLARDAGYRLIPATAFKAADTIVVRDTLWKCAGTACVATKSTSRPEIVCATAARKIGKLEAFVANGESFTAEQLAKCNEKAR